MKKLLLSILGVTIVTSLGFFFFNENTQPTQVEKLRAQHQEFLDNSPYITSQTLTKKERKALGLPPNAYFEQKWELEMDPNTGRPMPDRVRELQDNLRQDADNRGGVGDGTRPWIDRGPNNQGGRTRGILFDPHDFDNANPADDYTRVLAGGVSGGLWVNEDITDVNSTWSQVPNIPANISVTVIVSDPNDTKTIYIGSGESYTSGDAIGRGIWKSTDTGITWTNIFGGFTGTSNANQFVDGIFYINDVVARDVAGTTELYAAVAGSYFSNGASSFNQWLGLNEMGLYKSTDAGASWTRFAVQHGDGSFKNPNDIELDINNNIWFTTTSNSFGNAGGDIYKSTDGISFTLEETIANAARTELEVSATDANKFWVVANVSGVAALYKTDNAFTSISTMTLPNDADTGIPASDYTRGQAFYDLPIEADAASNLYVGGIDLFRSTDDGVSWTQLSKWSNNNNLSTLNNFVHADQHAIVFRPGDDNQVALGCDGGVFFANSMTAAASNTAGAIVEMEKGYNTVQFYYGSIDQANISPGDDIAGGAQDNGTFFKVDATSGANGYSDPLTGDGGYTEIDGADGYAVTFYPGNSGRYIAYPALVPFSSFSITAGGGGNFINQAALDTNLDILYTNATNGATYRLERDSEFIPGGLPISQVYIGSGILTQNPSALKVSPHTTTSTTLYVGQRDGVLWKVTDIDSGGGTWNTIGTFTGSIADIELGASELEIFVTMHNYGVTSVWYTVDGGTNWVDKEGNLPDFPVKCILQNPLLPAEVIVGTELGVWGTADFTATSPNWVQLYNGMSDVTVLDLDVRTSDNTVLATTHGRGFFTSEFTNIPLSVDEVSLTSKITIYPTVSDGEITVKSHSNLGRVNFEIYNLNGQKVYADRLDLSHTTNRLSLNLSSGIYIVKMNGDSFIESDKIIIK